MVNVTVRYYFIHFVNSGHFYSAPSSPLLLRGAPDYSTDWSFTEFHAEEHRQLQVKDLFKVPTWRLERESNPRPSGLKVIVSIKAPPCTCHNLYTGMLILVLVLVLVLKDSLRTFFKSLSLSWSLGVRSLSLSLSLGVRVQEVLVLILVLGGWGPGGPCPCPGPWGSGPCPYPGPCGLVLVLVLVFSPYKDLFPLFHYSDLFA